MRTDIPAMDNEGVRQSCEFYMKTKSPSSFWNKRTYLTAEKPVNPDNDEGNNKTFGADKKTESVSPNIGCKHGFNCEVRSKPRMHTALSTLHQCLFPFQPEQDKFVLEIAAAGGKRQKSE